MQKFQNKYRIPSARLASWDYRNPGFYFITICTKNRSHFFGEIINQEMHLNDIGKIADQCWAEIPDHFPNTMLGEFVIMPNHVHGIIIINEPATVETGYVLSPYPQSNRIVNTLPNETAETGHALSLRPQQPHFRFRNPGKNSISSIVGSFKSAVTKSSRTINKNFEWQTRFYDHIIRSHEDFVRISNYILNNPANW